MSNDNKNLSRRDFVSGRFWKAIGLGEKSIDDLVDTNSNISSPIVMRYPKTTEDVEINDSTDSSNPKETNNSTGQFRRTIPLFRPPGAVDEASFLKDCTRCNDCIDVCPHDAIVHAPAQFREAAGTPMLAPDHQPCMMCEEMPCIKACEPNVLDSDVQVLMGTAMVTEHLCLAHHGTTCTVCSEQCPVDEAILVSEGKPIVNESQCTGCGVCRYVCPAPENAILLMPAFNRPSPPEKQTNE